MNNKDDQLLRIVDAVVRCCATQFDGRKTVSVESVIGKSRNENVVMTRAMAVGMLLSAGYTTTTVSLFLNRSVQNIRYLLLQNQRYKKCSKAYIVSLEEAKQLIFNE